MINSYHDACKLLRMNKSMTGAATLIFSVVLLVLSTLIIIFAANVGQMQQKITANFNRGEQAYQAAEAGIEFGINYLQHNSATITATPSNGYISYSNASTTNVILANNSRFSVVYTNPTQNNYNLIRITATGLCDDGSVTKVLYQNVQRGSILTNPGTTSLVSKGNVSMGGNANVINTVTNQTIQAGGAVTFGGNSQTTINSGVSSNSGGTNTDVQQNVSAIANMSQSDFFANFFGTTSTATVKSQMVNQFNNSSDTNYSATLNGMTGTTIWIDQTNGSTARLNSNITIGSVNNPVLIVVNGNLDISGGATIYGFIFIIGNSGISTSLTGNNSIIGGLAATDSLNISGNSTLAFNANVLNNLRNNANLLFYARIPGSWRDF